MNTNDFLAITPLIILAASAILVMLLTAVKRNHRFINIGTIAALAAAFLSMFAIPSIIPLEIHRFIIVDGFALFYWGLLFLATMVVVLLSYAYIEQIKEEKEEFYILILIATLGAAIMVVSIHFGSFFLGLEILSVALYVMIGYIRERKKAIEGSIKYLIMAAASSAFLLFGIALVYAAYGTMEFAALAEKLQNTEVNILLLAGFGMLTVGLGFKLAVVPFHMWTPDVYEGAPAPVAAFIATVSKGGVFAFLLRFFIEINGYQYPAVLLVFSLIAIASMLAGNLLAMMQKNVKRILAYSSIAHLGYLLVAFLAGGEMGKAAATFYLTAYFITMLGAFGIVTHLSAAGDQEAEPLGMYKGLMWQKPWTAAVFTFMLLSLAGIPLTAGFVGKFYVAASGVNAALWWLVITLVLSSVIGLYYYLRIIVAMFSGTDEKTMAGTYTNYQSGVVLGLLTLLLLWLGVYPSGILDAIAVLL